MAKPNPNAQQVRPVSPGAAAAALQKDGPDAQAVAEVKPGALVMPAGVKVKRLLTLPSLNITEAAGGMFLKIMTGLSVSDVKDRTNQKDPAVICDVQKLDLNADGSIARVTSLRWLVPSVVIGNFIKSYSGNETGKAQALAIMEKLGGKERPEKMNERVALQAELLAAADLQIVGKVFAVQNVGKRTEAQRYWDFNIAEVELEAA